MPRGPLENLLLGVRKVFREMVGDEFARWALTEEVA